jgi:hypothetical protein
MNLGTVIQQDTLCDFENEPLRREPDFRQRLPDLARQIWRQELHGRQIHRNFQMLRPACRLTARLVQRPFPDGDDQAAVLGYRNEYRRRNVPPLRMTPACQCLEPGHLVGAQINQRLIIKF